MDATCMRIYRTMVRITTILVCATALASAQNEEYSPKHEIGLTLGRFSPTDRDVLRLGSGTALQANEGQRVWRGERRALYTEVHFLANPQRLASSANQTFTLNVTTFFLPPGVRVKFPPKRKSTRLNPSHMT